MQSSPSISDIHLSISCSTQNGHLSTRTYEACQDQIRSVAQSCPTLCDPMKRSTPGLPVQHQLPEFTETHVHQVSDASDIHHSRILYDPPSRILEIKAKINKWDLQQARLSSCKLIICKSLCDLHHLLAGGLLTF